MHATVITRDGLERLSAELEQLTTDGRREIADRLRHAASSEAPSDYVALTQRLESYVGIVDSPRVLVPVINSLHLHETPTTLASARTRRC